MEKTSIAFILSGNEGLHNFSGTLAGANSHNISNSYNTGSVSSTASAGGIAGSSYSSIVNCYYLNTTTKGIGTGTNSTPVTALTADQMKLQSSYTSFDFENIWQQGDFWPYLRVFPYNDLASISFKTISAQVAIGTNYSTKLQINPANTAFVNITYSSLDTSIATVQNGVISAMKAGTTSIIAKDTITNKAAVFSITVVQGVTGISVTGSKSTINKDETIQLSAAVIPANAANKTVSWSSSDNSIATVDQNGLVSSVSPGSATIYATSTDGTNIKGSFGITVVQAVQSVSLNASTLQMKTGESQTLTASVLPANATNKSVTWSSSNTAVSTVDANGKITARSRGTVDIIGKTVDGGFEAACAVTVVQPVTGVSFAKTTVDMGLGGQLQLVPIIAPSNANNQNVSWLSSDPSVSISSDGTITGVSEGQSVITVTTQDGNKSAMCVVNVGKAVTSIVLNKSQISLVEGSSQTLAIDSILPADAINQVIAWETSDASVATVSASGTITAIKPGTATILAEATDGSGVAATCSVTVNPITLIGIEITRLPTKLAYREMAAFDSAGMILTLTYGDNSTAPVTSGWTTDYDFSVSGSRTVVVHYGGFSTELTVTVNPFDVVFDSRGGSSVSGTAAHYNATIPAPATPTRSGYTFGGWYGEPVCIQQWNFQSDVVTGDITLYARWDPISYTVHFDSQDGNAIADIPADYGATISAPATPTRSGYTFGSWYRELSYIQKWNFQSDVVTGGTTLYARWDPISYTVRFDSQGGSAIADKPADYGTTISATATTPMRSGYTFGGWYGEPSCIQQWIFQSDVVSGDTTLYARWNPISYTVRFNSQGGGAVPGASVLFGSKIPKPTNPTNDDTYLFGGWYKEPAGITPWNFDFDTMPVDGVTLYARWFRTLCTVVFDPQDGSAMRNVTVFNGSKLDTPASPIRTGYTFGGWYKDPGCTVMWDFNTDTAYAKSMFYLYARWTLNSYTVRFDARGGSTPADTTATHGATISTPPAPVRYTYNFTGWYHDAACTWLWNFAADTVTGDMTLSAGWVAQNPSNYLGSIAVSAGGLNRAFSAKTTSYTVNLGENDAAVTITPLKDYYGAAMTIDGKAVSAKTIALANGKTATVTVKVTWNKKTTTYKLTVQRPKSTVNKLAALTTTAGTGLQNFDPNVTSYTLTLPENVGKVTLKAARASGLSTVSPASKAFTLKNGQSVKATFKVKAQSGATRTYTVTITRAKSTNANLASLKLSEKGMAPGFQPAVTDYAITLPAKTAAVIITAKAADKLSTVRINGAKKTALTVKVANGQSTTVTVTVTAQSGNVKSYVITVRRQ